MKDTIDKVLKGKVHFETDIEAECYANCRAVLNVPAIKAALLSDLIELIGEPESRETTDMSLKSWTNEDYKAFGKNELRSQLRTNLTNYINGGE